MTAPTSELQYVIRENQAIGFLLSAGPEGGYQAFDADGLTLGHYKSEELAAKAIYEQASNSWSKVAEEAEQTET
jgi:hypothetical protein